MNFNIKSKSLKFLSDTFATDYSSLLAFNVLIKKKYKFWKYLLFFVLSAVIILFGFAKFRYYTGNYIAKITIDNVIFTNDTVLESLEKVKNDKKIKAVIFKINSPGGTITGSEMLYKSIKDISAVKPTVALVYDMAASGAYMASIATNYIIAQNTSMIGSIGVLMDYWNLQDVAKKFGLTKKTIRTSEFKAAPNSFEEASPEVEKYLKDLLNDGYKYFVYLVKLERGKKIKNINEVTNGKVFTGMQALDLGLVDQIGNINDAVLFIEKNGKIKNAKNLEIKDYSIVEDKEQSSLFDKFFNKALSTIFNASKNQQSSVLMNATI